MAISWSNYYAGENAFNKIRVGLEQSWSSVSTGSSSATLTVKVWTQADGAYSNTQTLTYTGTAGSGSTTFTQSSGNGSNPAVLRATKTYTYTYGATQYGKSPGTRTFTASLSGAYDNASPWRSITATIPGRPYGKPAAPTGLSATRVSDTTADLAWTRKATTAAPYSTIRVYQYMWSGTSWGSGVLVATLSGSAASYRRSGLSANEIYSWQVSATNSAGESGRAVLSVGVNMTPDAPASVKAAVTSTGGSIKVSWPAPIVYGSTSNPARSYMIERSVNGGAWVSIKTGVTATTHTDAAPGAGSNAYRVRTRSDYGQPLMSAWTTSNTVSTIVPPLAPTDVQPNGTLDVWNEGAPISWVHQHGGDGAEQGRAEFQFSLDNGQTWIPDPPWFIEGDGSTSAIPPGIVRNGPDSTLMTRVRTRGVASAGFGPWSPPAVARARTRPTTTITPLPATWTTGQLTIAWSYALRPSPDANETAARVRSEVELRDGAGELLEKRSLPGSAATFAFSKRLEDQSSYTARVRSQSADGLWSAWSATATTVDFPEPTPVLVLPQWNPLEGTIALRLFIAPPKPGEVAAVAATVERRIDGGSWVTLGENIPVPIEIIDPLPTLAGVNEYRVTSISLIPTYAAGEPVTVQTPANIVNGVEQAVPWKHLKWVMLSSGEAWATTVKFVGKPDVSWTVTRGSESHMFSGRRSPLGAWSPNRSKPLSVSGRLMWLNSEHGQPNSSTPGDWEMAAEEATLVCLRDMHGNRVFGRISGDVSFKPVTDGALDISFDVERLDYTEVYAEPVIVGGETLDDFHIKSNGNGTFTAWGLSVNDNGDGTWTADSAAITDYNNGIWSAEETV